MISLGKKQSHSFIQSGWVCTLMIGFLLQSCGGLGGDGLITGCVLPPDQLGTLQGKWNATPVPIALSTVNGGFNATERGLISKAVETWNTFYGASLQLQVLDTQADTSQGISADLCASPIINSSNVFTRAVSIIKDTAWVGLDAGVVGITKECPGSGSPIRSLNSAEMYLNYRNFFTAGNPNPGLEETMLHELGHLLGLGHSCEIGFSQEEAETLLIPSCENSNLPQAYRDAIMFPTVSLAGPSGKTAIQSNDQGRANCLYTVFE